MEQSAPSSMQPAAIPSLAAPSVERVPATRRGTLRLAGATLLALVLHGAALAALVTVLDATSGEGGKTVDVVEVSLVSADALEPATGHAAQATGGAEIADRASAAPSFDANAATSTNAANGPDAPLDQRPLDRVTPELPSADPGLAYVPDPHAPNGLEAPTRVEPSNAPREPVAAPTDRASAESAGRSAAIAETPLREDAPAAAPTEGEVNAYNRTVAVTLAKLKPKGIGEAGLARIVFRIGSTGNVDDVQLAVSTGKSKLDRLAADTVARAKFDVPPAGMTTAQLTYAIAFRFR